MEHQSINLKVEVRKSGKSPWSRVFAIKEEGDVTKSVSAALDDYRREHVDEPLWDSTIHLDVAN